MNANIPLLDDKAEKWKEQDEKFGALVAPIQQLMFLAYKHESKQFIKAVTEQLREATGGYLP